MCLSTCGAAKIAKKNLEIWRCDDLEMGFQIIRNPISKSPNQHIFKLVLLLRKYFFLHLFPQPVKTLMVFLLPFFTECLHLFIPVFFGE